MQGGGGRENGRAGVGIARWDRGEGKRMGEGKGRGKAGAYIPCRMIPGEARMKMRRRMKCKEEGEGPTSEGMEGIRNLDEEWKEEEGSRAQRGCTQEGGRGEGEGGPERSVRRVSRRGRHCDAICKH